MSKYKSKQGQKLSIRTQVKVVIRSEGLKIKQKITKPLHNIKVIFQVIYNFMKKILFLHDIRIHTISHQNRFINECARMILI